MSFLPLLWRLIAVYKRQEEVIIRIGVARMKRHGIKIVLGNSIVASNVLFLKQLDDIRRHCGEYPRAVVSGSIYSFWRKNRK